MDYAAFYRDVVAWIQAANQTASQEGMESPAFWAWVAESTSALCKNYNEHRLAIKQMVTLVDWLEEVYESRRASQ